jgi:hypothetical protein
MFKFARFSRHFPFQHPTLEPSILQADQVAPELRVLVATTSGPRGTKMVKVPLHSPADAAAFMELVRVKWGLEQGRPGIARPRALVNNPLVTPLMVVQLCLPVRLATARHNQTAFLAIKQSEASDSCWTPPYTAGVDRLLRI